MDNTENIQVKKKSEQAVIQPLLLSAEQAAKLLGIGRSLFYSLHSSGELGPRPLHLGSRVLWRRSELERWINEGGCVSRSEWLKMCSGGK